MLSTEGTARLMAFADAVVAIAITLLVLPLVDIPEEAASTSLAEVWANHQAEFFMFALSFGVIARLWVSHHNFGERMARGDPFVMIMTLVWLLTVVFLPFPTELMGELGNTRPVSSLYIATMASAVTVLAVQGRYLSRRPAMWREGWSKRQMQVWAVGWWSNPVLAGSALLLALFVPGVGIWAMLLLFLDGPISAIALRRSGLTPTDEEAPATESASDPVDR